MKLFESIKKILLETYKKNGLIQSEPLKAQEGFLILNYISEKNLEQDIIVKEFKNLVENKTIPEAFYSYLLWIAGELMNNVFDHGQTFSGPIKGGIMALDISNNIAQLAIGDLGIGIKASLEKNPKLQKKGLDAKKAIKLALSESTSGWPYYKRGNGLPDVLRILKAGKGAFAVYSDQIILTIKNGKEKWQTVKEKLPGVIAAVELEIKDFKVPRRGLPKGKTIKLARFGKQLSGREKGQEAYEVLIKEITNLPKEGVLIIDLTNVIMMNSSFGDQALGVLLENIKQGNFGGKKVFFTGDIKEAVDLCLDRIAEIRNVEIAKV